MVNLISERALNTIVAHLDGVKHEVHEKAKEKSKLAEARLEEERASTRWHKIFGPGHLTRVTVTQGEVDSFINLEAPNAMAIEFGHAPSGVFGPGGRYGHIKTRPPEGLYIISRAAGLAE